MSTKCSLATPRICKWNQTYYHLLILHSLTFQHSGEIFLPFLAQSLIHFNVWIVNMTLWRWSHLLVPSVHSPGSERGRAGPGLLSDCCRRSLSGRGLGAWRSSYRTNRTLQIPTNPGSHPCLRPAEIKVCNDENQQYVFNEITTCHFKDVSLPPANIRMNMSERLSSSSSSSSGGEDSQPVQYCSATTAICSAVDIWPSCGTLLHCSANTMYIFIYLSAGSASSASLTWLMRGSNREQTLKEPAMLPPLYIVYDLYRLTVLVISWKEAFLCFAIISLDFRVADVQKYIVTLVVDCAH